MKTILPLLFIISGLIAAEPDFSNLKVEPLPFPEAPSNFKTLSVVSVEEMTEQMNAKIGGYPPKFKNSADRQSTYLEWSKAVLTLELTCKETGMTEPIAILLAAVYRQGHNMDVEQCGQKAMSVIEEGLKALPDSIQMNLQASYFYLQIDPKFAPKGEAVLLHLRQLLKSNENLEVERGLVFAYLYQNNLKKAKKQVDHCLKLAPEDQMFLGLQKTLKSGSIERKNY